MNRITYIYTLSNPVTNEVRYVGKSVRPNIRYKRHLRDKLATHSSRWIQSLLLQGITPIMTIIDECLFDWEEKEKYWIDYYRNMGCNLTNITEGGRGVNGYTHSNESKKKISLANKGKTPNSETKRKMSDSAKTKNFSDIHRLRISQSLRGRTFSEETRNKISISLSGRIRSSEHCRKLSESHKGLFHTEETKQKIGRYSKKVVNQYSLNQELINQWDSPTDASKSLNISRRGIYRCCDRTRKTYKGYIWRYADDPIEID